MTLQGKKRHASLRFISALELKHNVRKVCLISAIMVLNEGDRSSLDNYPFLLDLSNVLPSDLLELARS
jgi:hypothetical protein